MLMSSKKEGISVDKGFLEDNFSSDNAVSQQLSSIYEEISDKFKSGELILGTIVDKDSKGITVNIDYKSDAFISSFEFTESEFKELKVGATIEVMIDSLEDSEGDLILSFQKAKSLKVWNEVARLTEENGDIVGVVIGKVKGGLNVDVGIPAFLPGSQIDIQRITDFDSFIGQEVTCKILKINKKRGNIIVSRRKYLEEEKKESRKKSLEDLEIGKEIVGKVKNITSYGAFVDIGGVDGLLHVTDMSWGRIVHPNEMLNIGDDVKVKVISFDKEHAKISLGMKQLQENPWQDIETNFPKNSKVRGKISSIMDYGLFIEVTPGIEGLVHISEISWTERVQDLNSRYKVGDEVDVIISDVDKNERRMSLSIKRLDTDPWKAAFDKFKPGDKIKGSVNNVTDFGIFVKIHPGVDGLVHVSDISWVDHVEDPSKKYKKGDEIEVVVLAIEEEKRRISLGIKQLTQDPWEVIEKDYAVGKLVEGEVTKATSFGVFVRFDNGIEGLAHVSELADKEIPNISEFLPIGKRETFMVVKSSAADRKLGLSLKAVNNPDYKIGSSSQVDSEEKASRSNVSVKKEKDVRPVVKDSVMKGSLQIALEKVKKQNLKLDDEGSKEDKKDK